MTDEPSDDDIEIEVENEEDEDEAATPTGLVTTGNASVQTLAERYAKEMRQVFLQKIELPIKTLRVMAEDGLDLSPSFQRRGVWDVERQSRFIESVIMNVPIPPVFLGENEYGHYLVLDGRQRLTAILSYLNNDYELKKLHVWKELNKLRFRDLEQRQLDAAITRRFVPAILLLKESSPELKYDVFDRLNTGGVIAEPMEIRNAVYQGKFTEQMKVLADTDDFRKLWAIPLDDIERQKSSKLYQRMRDLELVLRFFALSDQSTYESEKLAFKDYLSHYMKIRNAEYDKTPSLLNEDTTRFANAARNALLVFGETAFVRSAGKRSAPLADAIMGALAKHAPESVKGKKAELKLALEELRSNDAYEKSLSRGTNGRGAIRERLGCAIKAVDRVMA